MGLYFLGKEDGRRKDKGGEGRVEEVRGG